MCIGSTRVARAKGAGCRRRRISAEFNLNDLRRAYFAQLSRPGLPAARYGVTADRVAAHVSSARAQKRRRADDSSRLHIADVALAVACIDGAHGAWSQLIAEHEPRLVRAAEPHVGPVQAVITVRRMLIDLRRGSAGPQRSALDLRRVTGEVSLEQWLVDRLMGRIAIDTAIRKATTGKRSRDGQQRLRMALELLRNERVSVQKLAEALAASAMDLNRLVEGERTVGRAVGEDTSA